VRFGSFGTMKSLVSTRIEPTEDTPELSLNWIVITDLGDAAVMVPVALAIAAWLLASRAWRSALAWLSLFGTGAFLVFCTQVAYAGWGIGVQRLDFTEISGHAMSATSVLTVAGYFVGGRFSKAAALTLSSLGYFGGILVGISRVILGDHSPSEVMAGCALGGAIALATIGMIRSRLRMVAAPIIFALTILTLVFTLHGQRAPSHRFATKVALYLSGRSTPFVRQAQ
jgi:membrane-associated phospholipid phosphatase